MKNKKYIPFSKIELPPKVLNECKKILASGNLTNNKYVERFEKEVAKISKTKYAVATNSCTTGLHLVMREVFEQGSVIGVPDYTWESTKSAVVNNGFHPFWLDVNINTCCVDNETIKKAEKKHWWRCDVNGYLVVDTFGNQCDIDTDEIVIVDCAHSFGVPFNSKYLAGVYSFAPAKTFTAGEGGCVVTNNKRLYIKLKQTVRWAGRMQEVNACIGLYYIKQHKKIIAEKRKIFNYYKKHLPFLTFQTMTNSNYNIVNVIITDCERDFYYKNLIKHLGTKIRYNLTSKKHLPVSKELFDKSFFLPIWKGIDYKHVVALVKHVHDNSFSEYLKTFLDKKDGDVIYDTFLKEWRGHLKKIGMEE